MGAVFETSGSEGLLRQPSCPGLRPGRLRSAHAGLRYLLALAPVSYTHLDVYKRQVLQSVVFAIAVGLLLLARRAGARSWLLP